MSRSTLWYFVLLAGALACSASFQGALALSLNDTKWTGGGAVLEFVASRKIRWGVEGGCNSGYGTYSASADGAILIESASTLVECDEYGQKAEDAFMTTLDSAKRFEATDSELKLFDAGGKELAVFRREQ